MNDGERLSTEEWLAENTEQFERLKHLGASLLGMTELNQNIAEQTSTAEIQEAARTYLASRQLHIFPQLVEAQQAVPYDELLQRQGQASVRLHAALDQLQDVESADFEEAAAVRHDALWVSEQIPELGETMAGIASRAIAARQQQRRAQLQAEQTDANAELEKLNAAAEDVGFIPLPVLATPEQQQDAYRAAHAITHATSGGRVMDGKPMPREEVQTTAQSGSPTEPELEYELGPGGRAGVYLAQQAGELVDIADVAEAVYGERTEQAARKIDALVYIAQCSARTPLTDQLVAVGLKLQRERHPLPAEKPGRQRYRIFLHVVPANPDPTK